MQRYGCWAGNPKGVAEDTEDCIEEVWSEVSWIPYQCSRKRGYGPDKLYCKQHAKMKEEREK